MTTTTPTKYHLNIDTDGRGTATIINEGETITVSSDSHPRFPALVAALVTGQPVAKFLTVNADLQTFDGVTVLDGAVLFNGEQVHSSLTQTILRYQAEGRPTEGLVKFLERLYANPSRRAREQLFDWVEAGDLVIDAEGYFLGFKGVRADLTSCNAGPAIVNGEPFEGHVPNVVGSVISMNREDVQDDYEIPCSVGLHVGTWEYAKGFGQIVLEVKVDPADVVSVPKDSGCQKLRCCRYEIIAIHEQDGVVEDFEPAGEDDYIDWGKVEVYIPRTFLGRLINRVRGRNLDEG